MPPCRRFTGRASLHSHAHCFFCYPARCWRGRRRNRRGGRARRARQRAAEPHRLDVYDDRGRLGRGHGRRQGRGGRGQRPGPASEPGTEGGHPPGRDRRPDLEGRDDRALLGALKGRVDHAADRATAEARGDRAAVDRGPGHVGVDRVPVGRLTGQVRGGGDGAVVGGVVVGGVVTLAGALAVLGAAHAVLPGAVLVCPVVPVLLVARGGAALVVDGGG